MSDRPPPIDQIVLGRLRRGAAALPERSVDLIFADPPYNLQLQRDLWRPNMTRVEGGGRVGPLPRLRGLRSLHREWLERLPPRAQGHRHPLGDRRYHNIYRVGTILMDLGYWILNDVSWIKVNPMPNFRGVRFTNAHETLIWAQK